MRSAFKRSTTLLASARRTARRQQMRPEQQQARVPEEELAATAPLLGSKHGASNDIAAVRPGPATPKRLDFEADNSAVSPGASHSQAVQQKSMSRSSAVSLSEISPILGFINPATVQETAEHAGLTLRGINSRTAAAATASRVQQGDPKMPAACNVHSNTQQQQHPTEGASTNHVSSSGSAAASKLTEPRSAAHAAAPRTFTSQLPRSPIMDKLRAARSSVLSATPQKPSESATAAAATSSTLPNAISALPRSPFNRLKAALQSQRRSFEQDARTSEPPQAMSAREAAPARRPEQLDSVDQSRHGSATDRSHAACIKNPHFREPVQLSSAGSAATFAAASQPLQRYPCQTATEDNDEVLRGSVSLPVGTLQRTDLLLEHSCMLHEVSCILTAIAVLYCTVQYQLLSSPCHCVLRIPYAHVLFMLF
jgi:hypothetical protein